MANDPLPEPLAQFGTTDRVKYERELQQPIATGPASRSITMRRPGQRGPQTSPVLFSTHVFANTSDFPYAAAKSGTLLFRALSDRIKQI